LQLSKQGIERIGRLVAALACAGLVGAGAGSLSGCAAGMVQAAALVSSPEMFASMFGQFETRSEFRESVPYVRSKDWLGLTVLARQKLEAQPNRGEWWQIAGYGHMQLGEMREARDCFARTVKLLPEEVGAWNLYAYSLKSLGDKSGAVAAVEKAIQTDPSSNTSFVILGELHREAGRLKPALQAYERAIDIDKSDIFAWYGLGLLGKQYNDKTTYERARKSLKELYPPMAEQLEKAKV
jgi:tetratricopeptide (TPR) repeat protein